MFCIRLIIISVLLSCTFALSSPGLDAAIDSAMIQLVNQNYSRARMFLDSAFVIDPKSADALYLKVTVDQTELLDYESYAIHGEEFLKLADSVLDLLNLISKSSDKNTIDFYRGNILGGKGIIKAKTGNWMGAVGDAMKSVSILKDVISRDSSFYAAYLGVGVFNYYLSQNLKWVPFMGDKSQEGLRLIEKSCRAQFPFNYAANNTLAWILIDRKEFRKADSIVNAVLSMHPENTIFLRIKARLALWTGRYDKAIQSGTQLYELSEQRKPVNWSDLLSGYQIVVESYAKKKDYQSCGVMVEKAMGYTIPAPYDQIEYVSRHSEFLRQMKDKCAKSE